MYERMLQNQGQKYDVEPWKIITNSLLNANQHGIKTYKYKSQQKKKTLISTTIMETLEL